MASIFFSNGFIVNYLKKIGFSDQATNLTLLTLPSLPQLLIILPLAYISDTRGMKKIGQAGNALCVIGFFSIGLAVHFPQVRYFLIIGGMSLFFTGNTFFSSNWFALISPAIRLDQRGRFFAWLRSSWQITGMILTAFISWIFHKQSDLQSYFYVICALTTTLIIRMFFYRQIPEVLTSADKIQKASFIQNFKKLRGNKGYMQFCRYTFLMSFFLAPLITMTTLYEKKIVGIHGIKIFTDARILTLGNMTFAGSLVGFWVGGFMADKLGNTRLFQTTNLIKSFIICGFVCLNIFPNNSFLIASALFFFYGLSLSAYGIGTTNEAMKHINAEQRAFGIAYNLANVAAGSTLAAIFSSLYLKFAEGWSMQIGTINVNHFQLYILFIAIGICCITCFFRLKSNLHEG